MSAAARQVLAFAGAQLILAGLFVSLYLSPAVLLQSCNDDSGSIVLRWRPATVPAGALVPKVVPFRGGYGLQGAASRRSELQLGDARLAKLDASAPYTITAEVQLAKAPRERAVVVSRAQARIVGFELGVNRRRQPYLALGRRRGRPAILTGESKLLPGRVAHLAAVIEPARRLALFVDGALVIELRGKNVPAPRALPAASWTTGNHSGKLHAFTGIVGTLRFHPRALTIAQLRAEVTALGLELRTAGFPAQSLTHLPKPKKKKRKSKPRKSKLKLRRKK